MSFDPAWLFASLIPGGIGFVLLVYGKKEGRWTHIVAGLLFMAYPYFTPTLLSLVVVGVGIAAALWYVGRLGW